MRWQSLESDIWELLTHATRMKPTGCRRYPFLAQWLTIDCVNSPRIITKLHLRGVRVRKYDLQFKKSFLNNSHTTLLRRLLQE
jgi:hypothetical protein